METPNYPNCGQCHYFVAVDAVNGSCHRYPPLFAGESSPREMHHWRFPLVSLHAWCGEFLPLRGDHPTVGEGVI